MGREARYAPVKARKKSGAEKNVMTNRPQRSSSPLCNVSDCPGRRRRPLTHGHIVDQTARRYAAALQAAGHRAQTFHDPSESHDSLAIGFCEADDAVTQQVGAFLSGQ